jgi:hypothetical protein
MQIVIYCTYYFHVMLEQAYNISVVWSMMFSLHKNEDCNLVYDAM